MKNSYKNMGIALLGIGVVVLVLTLVFGSLWGIGHGLRALMAHPPVPDPELPLVCAELLMGFIAVLCLLFLGLLGRMGFYVGKDVLAALGQTNPEATKNGDVN